MFDKAFLIKREFSLWAKTLFYQLVAGVHIERVWKFESTMKRTSSDDVISGIRKKQVFSRNFMEKTLGLTTGQAYWYIRHFLNAGMIRKLQKTEYVGNKGKQQALYKFILNQ